MGTEWTAEQYDEFYRQSDEYKKPHEESIYWPVWQEVLKRIPQNVVVLEVGCGTGQFASALFKQGVLLYSGYDISSEAVNQFIDKGPAVFVINTDFRTATHYDDYDYLVCLETLEHIEDDFTVLNRIRPGKRCLITVPSYDGPNHVRFFPERKSVISRYGSFFDHWEVDGLKLSETQIIWLVDGVRNEHN